MKDILLSIIMGYSVIFLMFLIIAGFAYFLITYPLMFFYAFVLVVLTLIAITVGQEIRNPK